MMLQIYTVIHTLISLMAIFTGFVVLFELLAGKRLDAWTKWFLITAVATTATGFFFPFHGITPAIKLGIISLLVLAVTIYARYPRRLVGAWRWIYVIGAVMALYFNIFVGIVQAFEKVPALNAVAPTQTEPPFKLTQLVALVLLVVLTILAIIRFRVELPARAANRRVKRSARSQFRSPANYAAILTCAGDLAPFEPIRARCFWPHLHNSAITGRSV
jgi:hypothetical protein